MERMLNRVAKKNSRFGGSYSVHGCLVTRKGTKLKREKTGRKTSWTVNQTTSKRRGDMNLGGSTY